MRRRIAIKKKKGKSGGITLALLGQRLDFLRGAERPFFVTEYRPRIWGKIKITPVHGAGITQGVREGVER